MNSLSLQVPISIPYNKTDISTYVYRVARNSIASCSSRDEFKEGNNGRGRNGRERSVPGNKKSFTFFHFLPLRIKGEKKGR